MQSTPNQNPIWAYLPHIYPIWHPPASLNPDRLPGSPAIMPIFTPYLPHIAPDMSMFALCQLLTAPRRSEHVGVLAQYGILPHIYPIITPYDILPRFPTWVASPGRLQLCPYLPHIYPI